MMNPPCFQTKTTPLLLTFDEGNGVAEMTGAEMGLSLFSCANLEIFAADKSA